MVFVLIPTPMKNIDKIRKTSSSISFRDYLKFIVIRNLQIKLKLLVGRVIDYSVKALLLYRRYVEASVERSLPRVRESRIRDLETPRMSNFAFTVGKPRCAEITEEILQGDPKSLNGYQTVALFVDKLLSNHRDEIRSVVNIGCGIDNICQYLSSKYTDIQFYSNDLMADLEEIHCQCLQNYKPRENWKFVPGYQLDLIKKGELRGDLVFCAGTAITFIPHEFDELLHELSQFAKYLYFFEGWEQPARSLNIFKFVKPEDINPKSPALGGTGYYYYNYFSLLEKHGFKIICSDLIIIEKLLIHLCARNATLTSLKTLRQEPLAPLPFHSDRSTTDIAC